MRNKRPLTLERLEDRLAPAAFAVPWPEADELTLSFAPDGTDAGGRLSALFRTLDARLPRAVWQREILRAFQTWAVEADINIGVVADGGQPIGTLGFKEGDPRFGDIRVGAYPMASDVLAVTDLYDPFIANTSVGDVFFNSRDRFGTGISQDSYDLYSVMLHEAGHVFGLGHSADPASAMYEHFNRVRTGLTAGDIADLRGLYGARPADALEGAAGNGSFATATRLAMETSVEADITTHADADVYRFTASAGALDVNLNAAGVSLLLGRLSVYDAQGRLVRSAVATDPLHNDLTLHLANLTPGATYYVKVASGSADVFGIGAYNLAVTRHPGAAPSPSPTYPTAAGVQALATTPGYVEHTYYEADSRLTQGTPAETFRVRSADIGAGLTNVMTVVLQSVPDAKADYWVKVLDDHGRPVNASVVYSGPGRLALQILGVPSNVDYTITVSGSASTFGKDYVLEADFAHDGRHLAQLAAGTLAAGQREATQPLAVTQSQQFHFALSGSDWSNPAATGVRLTITNAAGHAVYTLTAGDGATRTGDVFLNVGRYMLHFTRLSAGTAVPLLFQLNGTGVSDPLGPQLRDTTLTPADSPSASPTASLSLYFTPGQGSSTLTVAQPAVSNFGAVPTTSISGTVPNTPSAARFGVAIADRGIVQLPSHRIPARPSLARFDAIYLFAERPVAEGSLSLEELPTVVAQIDEPAAEAPAATDTPAQAALFAGSGGLFAILVLGSAALSSALAPLWERRAAGRDERTSTGLPERRAV